MTSMSAVQQEISDCRDMEGWAEQCQVSDDDNSSFLDWCECCLFLCFLEGDPIEQRFRQIIQDTVWIRLLVSVAHLFGGGDDDLCFTATFVCTVD